MQVKLGYILGPSLAEMHPELFKLIEFPAKHGGLRYDISKLGKAVMKEITDFSQAREKLCQDLAVEKEVEIDGEKKKTRLVVEEKEGKIVELQKYDIPEDKLPEFNKSLGEMLENDVKIECYPIKLSRLDNEQDCSGLNFFYLEPFIEDDRK